MQVYNIDEIGVSVVHKPGKVVSELEAKHVYSLTSAERGKNIPLYHVCLLVARFYHQ